MEEMSWKKVDGGQGKLKELQGKAVVLDFWATFCPPCVEEIPHLNSLQAKYGVENLQIVGLNVGGEDDRPLIADFAVKLKIAYPIAIPDDELSRFIFATRDDIPQTAVFDRKGRMIRKIIGFGADQKRELDAAVEQAINTN